MDLILHKILENKEWAFGIAIAGLVFLNLLILTLILNRSSFKAGDDSRQKLSGNENIQMTNVTGNVNVVQDKSPPKRRTFKFKLIMIGIIPVLILEVSVMAFLINQFTLSPSRISEKTASEISKSTDTTEEKSEKDSFVTDLPGPKENENRTEDRHETEKDPSPSRPDSEVQNGERAVRKFIRNVLQISVTFSDKNTADGFGFIVGERDDRLYAVTANHVVWADEPNVRAEDIQIRFCQDMGRSHPAVLLFSDSELDLALLELGRPSETYRWESEYFHPERNDKVWFIGRNRDCYIPTDTAAGHIAKEPVAGKFYVDMYSVRPGTSGAPLITEQGIVGMIIEEDGLQITATDIDTIRMAVTQKWRYPWNLKQSTDRRDEIRSAIGAENHFILSPRISEKAASEISRSAPMTKSKEKSEIVVIGQATPNILHENRLSILIFPFRVEERAFLDIDSHLFQEELMKAFIRKNRFRIITDEQYVLDPLDPFNLEDIQLGLDMGRKSDARFLITGEIGDILPEPFGILSKVAMYDAEKNGMEGFPLRIETFHKFGDYDKNEFFKNIAGVIADKISLEFPLLVGRVIFQKENMITTNLSDPKLKLNTRLIVYDGETFERKGRWRIKNIDLIRNISWAEPIDDDPIFVKKGDKVITEYNPN